MKVWKATSVSVNKGSRVVTVTTGDAIDSITINSWIQIGSNLPYEIKRGFIDGSTKKIELFEPWAGSNVSGQRAIAFPTRAEIEQLTQNVRDLIQSIETLENYSEFTRDSVVNLNDAASWRAALEVLGTSNTLTTGTGLTGGGNLSANRTISVDASTGILGDGSGQVRSNFELDNRYLKKDDISDATLILDFVNNDYRVLENGILTKKSFGEILSFSRSSSATMWTPNKINEVSSNIPRASSFDPEAGKSKGILIESTRTERVLYTNTFDNAWWSRSSGVNITSGQESIIENQQGYLVEADSTEGSHIVVSESGFSTNHAHRVWCVFKPLTGNYFQIGRLARNENAQSNSIDIDRDGNIVRQGSTTTGHYVRVLPDGTIYVSFTLYSISGGHLPGIGLLDANQVYSYTGAGESMILMHFGISEGVAGATTYPHGSIIVANGGTQVTRARDMVSIDNLTPWFNPNEGTIEIEFELAIDHETQPAGTSALFCLGPTGLTAYNKDSLNLLVSGTTAGRYILRYGTGSIVDLDNIFGKKGKALVSYDKDSARISINGGPVISIKRDVDTSTFTFLGLGNISGNYSLNGLINNFIYRPVAASDAKLQQLSII